MMLIKYFLKKNLSQAMVLNCRPQPGNHLTNSDAQEVHPRIILHTPPQTRSITTVKI